jgi:hypothetical protein
MRRASEVVGFVFTGRWLHGCLLADMLKHSLVEELLDILL